MGMDYYISPNKAVECQNEFPEGLSYFFEQVGGYEAAAEVAQVSRILQIDLSVFQEYDTGEEDEPEIQWHSIDKFLSIIEEFISKINSYPEYYKEVIHNGDRDHTFNQLKNILSMQNKEEAQIQFEKFQNTPLHHYPADRSYLSSGEILYDLHSLKRTLLCYKEGGATEIQLVYA